MADHSEMGSPSSFGSIACIHPLPVSPGLFFRVCCDRIHKKVYLQWRSEGPSTNPNKMIFIRDSSLSGSLLQYVTDNYFNELLTSHSHYWGSTWRWVTQHGWAPHRRSQMLASPAWHHMNSAQHRCLLETKRITVWAPDNVPIFAM